jgi:hypothetical protein
MQLLLATLCDSAADYNGKLCVLGAFDTLCAPQFPVVHPQCSLALRLMFTPKEAGRHQFQIQFMDETGTPLIPPFPPDRNLDVNFPPGVVPFVTRNLVLNLQHLRFDRPGIFRFHITLDDAEVIALPLRVTRFEELRAAASPAG